MTHLIRIAVCVLLLLALSTRTAWAICPTVVTRTAASSNASADTSHVLTLSGTAQAGELLVGCIASNGAVTAHSWSTWTELFDTDQGNVVASCAYKVAVGGETTENVTSTGSDTSHYVAFRISGQHVSSAPEAGTTSTGSSVSPDPPSLSFSWGAVEQTLVIAVAFLANNQGFTGYPAGYSNTQQAGGAAQSENIGSAENCVSAASENPGAFTQPTGSWAANTLAIRPAAACAKVGSCLTEGLTDGGLFR